MPYEHTRTVHADAADLHAREVESLVAFLCGSDRTAGVHEAERVAEQAFLEVAVAWPDTGIFSGPEVYLFACAQRIASTRSQGGRPTNGDAFSEAASALWDPADLARLTVLQDNLDGLLPLARHTVLLREMCGFSAAQTAEVTGVAPPAVDRARTDAVRLLGLAIESSAVGAASRRGPLSQDDFLALRRVLGRGDGDRLVARRELAGRLARARQPNPPAGPPPGASPSPALPTFEPGPFHPEPFAPTQAGYRPPAPPDRSPSWSQGPTSPDPATGGWSTGGWSTGGWSTGGWSPGGWSGSTPLDLPLSALDLSADVGTPLFDEVSAWFASGPTVGGGNPWAALNDGGWQAASARAAAEPEVAGIANNGLPQRHPGANMVPSAFDVDRRVPGATAGARQVDASQVRQRLGRFHEGVTNARRKKKRPAEPAPGGPAGFADPAWSFGATATAAPAGPPPPRQDPGEAYDMFYREYLPQLLALLLTEGAQPVLAAELAQDALNETRRHWAGLTEPRGWARDCALSELERHRGIGGP